jgi:hypothetical protein
LNYLQTKEDIIITQQAIEDGTNWMDEELDDLSLQLKCLGAISGGYNEG